MLPATLVTIPAGDDVMLDAIRDLGIRRVGKGQLVRTSRECGLDWRCLDGVVECLLSRA
jgi:hypothetical protein